MSTPTEAEPPLGGSAQVTGAPGLSGRSFGLGLAAIAILGFAWRLAFTLISKGSDSELFDEGDAFFYSAVATNLGTGHFFVNPFNGAAAADHPPLTVLVLGPTSWLFTGSVLAQRLTMTVIGTCVIVAIGFLGRRLAGGWAGLGAAGLAAISPNLWINDAVVMSEAPSALLIVAVLAAGFALAERPSLLRALIAGATVGLTVLARAEIALFAPLMIAPILLRARDLSWGTRLGRLTGAGAAMVLVMAPWTLWNLSQFEKSVVISTNDGTTLLGANCEPTYRSGIVGSWSLTCVLDSDVSGIDASEASVRQRASAWEYALENRGRWPLLIVAREGRTFGFWRPDQQVYANTGEGRPEWASWGGYGAFWLMIPLAVAGAVGLRRRAVTLIPPAAALATVVLVSALFYGIPRFRLPLDVAMCLLGGIALADIASRFGNRRTAEPAKVLQTDA